MLDVTVGYGRFSHLITFFGNFHRLFKFSTCLKRYIFIKISQIVCKDIGNYRA